MDNHTPAIASERMHQGMRSASAGEGAEWPQAAMRLIRTFTQMIPGQTFLVEQLNQWAGSERPGNGKAWGPIIQKAARMGIIERAGYAPALTSNNSPKCLWRVR